MEVRLIVDVGGRSGHTFRMRAQEMIVGRKKGCGLRIPSAAVSREHCRLQYSEGILTVEDLGSINGTVLNGEPVAQRSTVHPGDHLTVGPVTFSVEYEMDAATLKRLARQEAGRANPAPFDFRDEELPVLEESVDALPPLDDTDDFALPVLEEEPLVELELANDVPLELPADGQLRDFLEQLDEPGKGKK
jgi:predicted component of type VI protein secretion system